MFKQFARRIATVRCYATKECASVEDFKSVVAQGKGLTIVDFYASMLCEQCKSYFFNRLVWSMQNAYTCTTTNIIFLTLFRCLKKLLMRKM